MFDICCTRVQTDYNMPEGGYRSIPITSTLPGVISPSEGSLYIHWEIKKDALQLVSDT